MTMPVLNFLMYHPDPVRRGALRRLMETATGLPCSAEGDLLPSVPLANLHSTAVVVVYRADGWGRAAQKLLRCWRDARDVPHLMVVLPDEDASVLRVLLDIGVGALVGPGAGADDFAAAVKALSAGGAFISGTLVRAAFSTHGRAENDETDAFGLTPREREILVMIALGLSNKDVARRLSLSVRTVETHRLNIRKKTRAQSRRDLVEVAERLGLLIEYGTAHGLAERRAAPGFHED